MTNVTADGCDILMNISVLHWKECLSEHVSQLVGETHFVSFARSGQYSRQCLYLVPCVVQYFVNYCGLLSLAQ